MHKWTKTLTAAVAALATAVTGAPPGHAQPTRVSAAAVARHRSSGPGRVVNLRVGEHTHFDRVVIDVRGTVPPHKVHYVHRLTYEGSGNHVPLHGRRFMAVRMYPATTANGEGANVYEGPVLQQYSMPVLRGVALIDDFEGYVAFGIALRRHVDYRVSVLHKPRRILIDLHH
jgi:hypothetical protein